MNIKWLGLVSIMASMSVHAACPQIELVRKAAPDKLLPVYESCAIYANDDESQSILAHMYATGSDGVQKDLNRALYYYQLSAENGNAESQTQLARLYIELDKSPATRKLMVNYLNTIYPVRNMLFQQHGPTNSQGELMHPYMLLLLASEPAANKWFYSSEVLTAPASAETLLNSYPISEEKKKKQMRAASLWKKRKLLEAASVLLSEKEYNTFKEAVYPEAGPVDKARRQEALTKFRQQYETYKKGK